MSIFIILIWEVLILKRILKRLVLDNSVKNLVLYVRKTDILMINVLDTLLEIYIKHSNEKQYYICRPMLMTSIFNNSVKILNSRQDYLLIWPFLDRWLDRLSAIYFAPVRIFTHRMRFRTLHTSSTLPYFLGSAQLRIQTLI